MSAVPDPPQYRVNSNFPGSHGLNPFDTAHSGNWEKWWLPSKPDGTVAPHLHDFWAEMSTGITYWKTMAPIQKDPPKFHESPTPSPVSMPMASSRFSRSLNWSGATVRTTAGQQFTQVAGSWVEPEASRVGQGWNNSQREFRSSIWVGLNGHANHLDAALPQAGTCQQIAHTTSPPLPAWVTRHWAWFQWWAIGKGSEEGDLRTPVYVEVDLHAGDRVWFYIELIDGDPAEGDPPQVARVTICIEEPAPSGGVVKKTLVMPFLMYPPTNKEGEMAEVGGTTANWIVELPRESEVIANADIKFLMPHLEGQGGTPVTLLHCVAACADSVGGPVLGERTLEVSKRVSMIDIQKDDGDQKRIRVMSEEWRASPDEEREKVTEGLTTLQMVVPGNGA